LIKLISYALIFINLLKNKISNFKSYHKSVTQLMFKSSNYTIYHNFKLFWGYVEKCLKWVIYDWF